jgi:hypothetical protein
MSADYSWPVRRAYVPPDFVIAWNNLRTGELADLVDDKWLQVSTEEWLLHALDHFAVPPDRACYLLDLFLGKADREIMRGDLEEEFATSILPRYGERRARFWFWWQTVRTIATRNAVCRWGLLTGLARLGEWISRGING